MSLHPKPAPGPGHSVRAPAASVLALVALLAGCAQQPTRTEEPEPARTASAVPADPGFVPRTPAAGASEMRVLSVAQDVPAPDPGDVWERIRAGLSLPIEDRRRIGAQIDWFSRHQTYLDRVAARARRYLPHIVEEVERRGLPTELALLPIVESAFRPFAFSPAGAAGMWQFMPSTGRVYGLRQTWWYDGRRDVIESTRAALDYLERLAREFSDDWLLAIAAYNSGEGNVARAVRRNRRAGKTTDFWSLRLPRETRAYVPRLLAIAAIVADPEGHGVELAPVEDRVDFAVVPVKGQIDVAILADASGVSIDELYLLNPGLKRFATDPAGPHRLLVPAEDEDRVQAALAELPADERMGWKIHTVQAGDSLGALARAHHVSVAALRDANAVSGSRIVVGDELRIPVAAHGAERYALSERSEILMGRRGTPGGTQVAYRVRRGDSLWLIARRHGTSVRRLASWNGISTRATLRPGQRLVVWDEPARKPTPRAVRAPGTHRGAGIYTVRSGDNLSLIARRHRVSVDDLTTWNQISRRDTLRIGQELRVQPVSTSPRNAEPRVQHTVRRGDSLWEISRRYGVSVSALRTLNGLAPDATLRPGQRLTVRAPARQGV